jgi:hypothetical protein
MKLDTRSDAVDIVIDDDLTPTHKIGPGDGAILYHEKNLIFTIISEMDSEQFEGIITRSYYDPDKLPDLTSGNTISFKEENIFAILEGR